eukprot:766647-Hanusia_phi.AAC.3
MGPDSAHNPQGHVMIPQSSPINAQQIFMSHPLPPMIGQMPNIQQHQLIGFRGGSPPPMSSNSFPSPMAHPISPTASRSPVSAPQVPFAVSDLQSLTDRTLPSSWSPLVSTRHRPDVVAQHAMPMLPHTPDRAMGDHHDKTKTSPKGNLAPSTITYPLPIKDGNASKSATPPLSRGRIYSVPNNIKLEADALRHGTTSCVCVCCDFATAQSGAPVKDTDKRIEDLKKKLSSKEGDLKDLQDRFIDLVERTCEHENTKLVTELKHFRDMAAYGQKECRRCNELNVRMKDLEARYNALESENRTLRNNTTSFQSNGNGYEANTPNDKNNINININNKKSEKVKFKFQLLQVKPDSGWPWDPPGATRRRLYCHQ